MKLFQKAFIFFACVFTIVLMCGAPGYLMHYLDTALEWERTDGIRKTGPIGNSPFFIMFFGLLIPPALFVVVSQFFVFRFAHRSFMDYVNVHKSKGRQIAKNSSLNLVFALNVIFTYNPLLSFLEKIGGVPAGGEGSPG